MGRNHWRLVLGAISAAYGFARAVLDSIGYVDLIIAHRNSPTETWLGELMDFLFSPPSWTVFLFVPIGGALIWRDLKRTPRVVTRHVHHKELQAQIAPEATLSVEVNRAPKPEREPDEWVQNAVRFVTWGHWNPRPGAPTTREDAERIFVTSGNCLDRMAQLAHRRKLTIWGSAGPGHRVKPIKPEYWEDHQIPVVNVLDGREKEKVRTDSCVPTRATETHENLQINEQEFVTLWLMPLSEAATRAYEETRGSFAARSSQMRHSDGKPQILNWYGYALIGSNFDAIPLYGVPPPSRKFERISTTLLLSSAISDDATTLNDKIYRQVRFGNLSIAREDLEGRISEIRSWG